MVDGAKVYAEELAYKNHGFPMWYPDPETIDEVPSPVVIGDVGFISKNGGFRRLFNVMVDEDHPLNEGNVPEGFQKLKEHKRLFNRADAHIQKGVMPSVTTKTVEVSGNVDVEVPGSTITLGGNVSIQLSGDRGAALYIEEPGFRSRLEPSATVRNYVKDNHEKWYRFATQNFGLDNKVYRREDIIFVHGFIKTTEWKVAYYVNKGRSAVGGSINAQSSIGGTASGQASSSLTTSTSDARDGPPPRLRGVASHPSHNRLPLELDGSDTQVSGSGLPFTQCVFLQYYEIKYRIGRFLRTIKAHAGDDELPNPDDNDEMDISIVPGVDQIETPLSILLDYMLKVSSEKNAKFAIASYGDLEQLYNGMDLPKDLASSLKAANPKVDVDKDGVATLSTLELIKNAIRRRYEENVPPVDLQDEISDPSPVAGPSNAPAGPSEAGPSGENAGGDTPPSDDIDIPPPRDRRRITSTQRCVGTILTGRLLHGQGLNEESGIEWPHINLHDKTVEGGSITSISLSVDGQYIVTGSEDTIVRIWDMTTYERIHALEGHEDTVWAVAYSPDRTKVVSGSADKKGKLWDTGLESGNPRCIADLNGHTGDVWVLAYSPCGQYIATGSVDCTVRLWNGESGEHIGTFGGHRAVVMVVAFSPDSKTLISCADSIGFAWDVPSANPNSTTKYVVDNHEGVIWSLAFSPDGSRFLTAAEDHTSRIWNTESGVELVTFREHTGPVWTAAFSPDGKQIASGSYDMTLAVNDSFSGERYHELTKRPSIIITVAFSPDGELLASGAADGTVKLWDVETGALLAEYQGHDDKVKIVEWTPDGKDIISASDDGTVRIWSALDVLKL